MGLKHRGLLMALPWQASKGVMKVVIDKACTTVYVFAACLSSALSQVKPPHSSVVFFSSCTMLQTVLLAVMCCYTEGWTNWQEDLLVCLLPSKGILVTFSTSSALWLSFPLSPSPPSLSLSLSLSLLGRWCAATFACLTADRAGLLSRTEQGRVK